MPMHSPVTEPHQWNLKVPPVAEANQPGLRLTPQAHRALEKCRWVIDVDLFKPFNVLSENEIYRKNAFFIPNLMQRAFWR
ncbi:MAG: hypothetical protein ACE5OZ_10480 [Candidatus Heimdallarchaeota archaeon]